MINYKNYTITILKGNFYSKVFSRKIALEGMFYN